MIGKYSFQEITLKVNKILQNLIEYNISLSPTEFSIPKKCVAYFVFCIEVYCISCIQSNIVKIFFFQHQEIKGKLKKSLV